MDKLTPKRRSDNMRAIRSKDMKPELAVRSLVHRLGYRFRLHRKDLPGKPDLVFPRSRKVIFVHGCFWHCHNCNEGRVPRSNREYWEPKLQRNRLRDKQHLDALGADGWRSLIVWECEIRDESGLRRKINAFLD